MAAMPQVRCPVCGRQFQPEQSPAMPFCGQRCRLVDLGRWLDQRYALPQGYEEEAQQEQPPEGEEPA